MIEEEEDYDTLYTLYKVLDENGRVLKTFTDRNDAHQYLEEFLSLRSFILSTPPENPIYQDLEPAFAKVIPGDVEMLGDRETGCPSLWQGKWRSDEKVRWTDVPIFKSTDPYTGRTTLDEGRNQSLERGLALLERELVMRGLVRNFKGELRSPMLEYDPLKFPLEFFVDRCNMEPKTLSGYEVATDENDENDICVRSSVDRFPHADEMLQEIRDIVAWENRCPYQEEIEKIVDKYVGDLE